MGSLRLDLGVALFGGRFDPYALHAYGLYPYGFPPTGPGGRTFRWPPGSVWLGSLWFPPDWTWGHTFRCRLDLCGVDPYGLDPCGFPRGLGPDFRPRPPVPAQGIVRGSAVPGLGVGVSDPVPNLVDAGITEGNQRK